jgi:hypothetical protein
MNDGPDNDIGFSVDDSKPKGSNTNMTNCTNNNNKNSNVVNLELTEKIKEEGIVNSFVFDKRVNSLILSLNHLYNNKTVISPVFQDNWPKTSETFTKQMKLKGVRIEHTPQLSDVVDNNFVKILSLDSDTDSENDDQLIRKRRCIIRKYTANGTLPLHESIVIVGQPPTFLHLVDDGRPQYTLEIETDSKIVYPSDKIDTQNPLPYIFDSTKELKEYLELARKETFDTLLSKVQIIYRKYVNTDEHYIVILAADTIYSYFQDKFGTTHYNIFVGDNGSGKNSALLAFKYLGYRVFYVTAASTPNYFTFLGEIEEGQGTIAEDEADDIAYDKDKRKILKTGYCSGGTVPKVDLSNGRTQGVYLTYCHKWLAMETLPDYAKIKGILDRSFIYNFITGDVSYNIKDVIQHAGDQKYRVLFDELKHTRKVLFAFRMLHYHDVIPDINLNIVHRSAELTKPLLRLFSCRGDSQVALEKIRFALSKFIEKRNELKKNSVESKLRDAINNLIKKRKENPKSPEYNGLEPCAFYNEQIWAEVKTIIDGIDIPFKTASFYSVDYGVLSHKFVTRLYRSKFKADPFRVGSGNGSRRGLKFSNDVLDRLGAYYDVPDEIEITSDADNGQSRGEDTLEREGGATDATDATHYGDRQEVIERIQDGRTEIKENNSSAAYSPGIDIESNIEELVNHQNNAAEISSPPSTSVVLEQYLPRPAKEDKS